jgi:hypothetical protein
LPGTRSRGSLLGFCSPRGVDIFIGFPVEAREQLGS